MTDWLGIIDRAAYTRFSRTGSLEPFALKRADLLDLVMQAAGMRLKLAEFGEPEDGLLRIQVRVPIPSVGAGLMVLVDEWKPTG